MDEWCGAPTVMTALRIMNASASFFFCSWVCGHFNRVSHQQAVEGWLAEISRQVERVLKALQGVPKDLPEASRATVRDAIDQIATANTAIMEARTNIVPGMGWYSEWTLPPRLQPNPAIYDSGTANPVPAGTATNLCRSGRYQGLGQRVLTHR